MASAEDYDLFLRAVSVTAGAPLVSAGRILSLAATEAGNNPTWLTAESHPDAQKYEDLLYEFKGCIDPAEKSELCKEFQETEREIITVCWLLCGESNFVLNSNMRGHYVTGNVLNLEKVYFVEE